jgi:hypothetical protein
LGTVSVLGTLAGQLGKLGPGSGEQVPMGPRFATDQLPPLQAKTVSQAAFHQASPYSQTSGREPHRGGMVHGEPTAGAFAGHNGLHGSPFDGTPQASVALLESSPIVALSPVPLLESSPGEPLSPVPLLESSPDEPLSPIADPVRLPPQPHPNANSVTKGARFLMRAWWSDGKRVARGGAARPKPRQRSHTKGLPFFRCGLNARRTTLGFRGVFLASLGASRAKYRFRRSDKERPDRTYS